VSTWKDECPFNGKIAVSHEDKVIVCSEEIPSVGHLIHEMGHVFATTKKPNDSNEWDFFAWEVALAKELGVYSTWLMESEDYLLDFQPGETVGDALKNGTLDQYIGEASLVGKRLGNLVGGRAVSVRVRKRLRSGAK
jgi:hypothetical protein